jgi:replicative DNA helicase
MKTMVETIEDAARMRRLTEFATDAAHLADQRADLDRRKLVDDLHRDLIELEEER